MSHTEEQTTPQTAETAENDSASQKYTQFLKKIWNHPFVSEESRKRRDVMWQLERKMRENYLEPFTVHLIGSSLIGTAHAKSDVDICFALPATASLEEFNKLYTTFNAAYRAWWGNDHSNFLRELGVDAHYVTASTEHINFDVLRKSLRTHTKRKQYVSTISDRSLLLDRMGMTVFLPALDEFNSAVVREQVTQLRRERFAVAELAAQQLGFNPEQFWNDVVREVLQHTGVYPGNLTDDNDRFVKQQKHIAAHIEARASDVPKEKEKVFQTRARSYVASAQKNAVFPDYALMRKILGGEHV